MRQFLPHKGRGPCHSPMKWLRKIELATLEQSSDVPYVILADGVHLCFDNLYYEVADKSEHHIKFVAHKQDLIRKSASCCRFKQFPTTIPFKNILSLGDTVVNGRIIKTATDLNMDPQNIIVIRSKVLSQLTEDDFQSVVDTVDDYDAAFLLTGNEIGDFDRLLLGSVHMIPHRGWHYSCVAITDHLCEGDARKYCWTQRLPGINMKLYGSPEIDDTDIIAQCFEDIGISDTEIIWG